MGYWHLIHVILSPVPVMNAEQTCVQLYHTVHSVNIQHITHVAVNRAETLYHLESMITYTVIEALDFLQPAR